MSIICKHGLDEKFCATCQQVRENGPLRRDARQVRETGPLRRDALQVRETGPLRRDAQQVRETGPLRRDARRETDPLRRDALRVTDEGKPALLLRTILRSLDVTVLVLDGKTLRFETVKEISLRHPMTVISLNQRKVLDLFLHLTLQKGFIFHPHQELTYREQIEEGSPRCTFDHSELSLEKGSLGCTQCRTYLCQCGRCRCGYTGRNTLGQVFSYPPLPIPREERLEYIRVVRFCDLNIEPIISVRKKRPLYLVSTRDRG